jgi:integrase
MIGGIYCTKCGVPIGRTGCPQHPGRFRVQFSFKGQRLFPAFASYPEAEQALNTMRLQRGEGTLDLGDWKPDQPNAFENVTKRFLAKKTGKVKAKTLQVYTLYLGRAAAHWRGRNIKTIQYADIEDFLDTQTEVKPITQKRIRDAIHVLFVWAKKRQIISSLPEFPTIQYSMAMRQIVDRETQQAIIDEVRRISWHVNPKIWLGIDILATCIALRPKELMSILEGDLNLGLRLVVIPDPKERKPKVVPLLDEHIEVITSIPQGVPHLPLFRHPPSYSNQEGRKFGEKYLYKWWKRACANLGIEGVDLYGGTRHSTACAMREEFSPEQIKRATMHSTNAAFERYFQMDPEEIREQYASSKIKREYFSGKTNANEYSVSSCSPPSRKLTARNR